MTKLWPGGRIVVEGVTLDVVSATRWRLPDRTDIVARPVHGGWGSDAEWHVNDGAHIATSLARAVAWWATNATRRDENIA